MELVIEAKLKFSSFQIYIQIIASITQALKIRDKRNNRVVESSSKLILKIKQLLSIVKVLIGVIFT